MVAMPATVPRTNGEGVSGRMWGNDYCVAKPFPPANLNEPTGENYSPLHSPESVI